MADFDVWVSDTSDATRSLSARHPAADTAASPQTAGHPQGALPALISCLPLLGAVLLAAGSVAGLHPATARPTSLTLSVSTTKE